MFRRFVDNEPEPDLFDPASNLLRQAPPRVERSIKRPLRQSELRQQFEDNWKRTYLDEIREEFGDSPQYEQYRKDCHRAYADYIRAEFGDARGLTDHLRATTDCMPEQARHKSSYNRKPSTSRFATPRPQRSAYDVLATGDPNALHELEANPDEFDWNDCLGDHPPPTTNHHTSLTPKQNSSKQTSAQDTFNRMQPTSSQHATGAPSPQAVPDNFDDFVDFHRRSPSPEPIIMPDYFPTPSKRKKPTAAKPTAKSVTDMVCTVKDLHRQAEVNKHMTESQKKAANARNIVVYTASPFDSAGNYVKPPKDSRLSDEHVYWATKHLSQSDRKDYSMDFNRNGHIKADRIPQDPAPIAWVHGMPTVPVYRDYYILCGGRVAKRFGFRYNTKADSTINAAPSDWTWGRVFIDKSLRDDSTLPVHRHDFSVRTFNTWDGGPTVKRGNELQDAHERHTDLVACDHHHLALVITSQAALLKSPVSLPGYSIFCGPGDDTSIQTKGFFTKHKIAFDWADAQDAGFHQGDIFKPNKPNVDDSLHHTSAQPTEPPTPKLPAKVDASAAPKAEGKKNPKPAAIDFNTSFAKPALPTLPTKPPKTPADPFLFQSSSPTTSNLSSLPDLELPLTDPLHDDEEDDLDLGSFASTARAMNLATQIHRTKRRSDRLSSRVAQLGDALSLIKDKYDSIRAARDACSEELTQLPSMDNQKLELAKLLPSLAPALRDQLMNSLSLATPTNAPTAGASPQQDSSPTGEPSNTDRDHWARELKAISPRELSDTWIDQHVHNHIHSHDQFHHFRDKLIAKRDALVVKLDADTANRRAQKPSNLEPRSLQSSSSVPATKNPQPRAPQPTTPKQTTPAGNTYDDFTSFRQRLLSRLSPKPSPKPDSPVEEVEEVEVIDQDKPSPKPAPPVQEVKPDFLGEGRANSDVEGSGRDHHHYQSSIEDNNEADDHEADDHESDDHEADDHEADDHEADDHEADDHEADDHEADDHFSLLPSTTLQNWFTQLNENRPHEYRDRDLFELVRKIPSNAKFDKILAKWKRIKAEEDEFVRQAFEKRRAERQAELQTKRRRMA